MTTDASQSALIQTTQQALTQSSQAIWFAGEGEHEAVYSLANNSKIELITNRYDVYQGALKASIAATFSDWQAPKNHTLTDAFFRINKEKPTNLHIANIAYNSLKPGGHFYICGEKNEGIKGFASTLAKHFDIHTPLKKQGDTYTGTFQKPLNTTPLPAPFDSKNYTHLRTIGNINNQEVFSKPGVYGWNKMDAGSELLIQCINSIKEELKNKATMLDIGCGYGYLTLACQALPFEKRTATDNNAAALNSMQHNAKQFQMDVDVIAGDCANTVQGKFDVILCNPPFHTGFNVNNTLTDKFLNAAKLKLNSGGTAFFVVNSFIPIEKKAAAHFRKVETLTNNKKFKVLALKN